MKQENERSSEQVLHKALGEWLVKDLPLSPNFQDQVWHRIELLETQTPTSLLGQLVASVLRPLTKPSLALSYFVVLLLAGLLAGYLQAQTHKAHTIQSLSSRYVQMMDPFQGR